MAHKSMLQHQFLTSKTIELRFIHTGFLLAENKRIGIEDFADHVADCDWVDLPLYGASFTWSNMRKGKEMEIRCRLDLFLIYSDGEDLLQDTIKKAGTTFASDHDLILLFFFEQLPSTVPFSFELMCNTSSKEEKLPNLNNKRRAKYEMPKIKGTRRRIDKDSMDEESITYNRESKRKRDENLVF
ncbi:hypothetical protein G4B88_002374 (mitochondrion) [Cannabis sativa]|uniref:Uncharacterized protein n=1 Tax=Cannabis sativa TaxID=3483 RepID=A0A7J6DV31_CANSA|nr:hypothetical protein G4B88_002374 [Cannabis sativa]